MDSVLTHSCTESDIKGGNDYNSPFGSEWASILVRTGVFRGDNPSWKPKVIVEDVFDAVAWALEDAKK